MPKNSGCNSCTNATCQHSLSSLGISGCVECENGVLVLDCTLAPSWKLGCNRCDVIISIFKGATKITVDSKFIIFLFNFVIYVIPKNAGKQCECGAQLVNVVYKSDKTKFKDGCEEKIGCVFCSQEFTHLVEKHRAITSRPANARGGRGGGRGGNKSGGRGGGASRGRPKQPKDKMAHLAAYFV